MIGSTRYHFVPLVRHGLRRCYSTLNRAAPSICIVGSGPGGFYTAQRLLKLVPEVKIDILERLPVPYGLVRFGVAPDHPEVKNVINTFEKVAESPQVRFIGNVEVGTDISMAELQERYSGIVLAYGADQDKTFGLPGEECRGVLSARDFVGWYNGLPDCRDLQPDLSGDTAVVLGQGNVALDCARILLSPIDALAKTDITQHALDALSQSKIRKVFCVGRRGPLQAAFTIKELREMTRLPDCITVFRSSDMAHAREGLSLIPKEERARKRITELMLTTHDANKPAESAGREFHLVFCRSPAEFLRTDGRLCGVQFKVNELVRNGLGVKAVSTDHQETIACSLGLVSIGYQSTALDGAPFDDRRHVVPNTGGVVLDSAQPSTGARLYCAGWVKRGPTGVILSTMNDAFETAESIAEDVAKNRLSTSQKSDTADLLASRKVRVVSFSDWRKIEFIERMKGEAIGKPAEKLTDVQCMLEAVS